MYDNSMSSFFLLATTFVIIISALLGILLSRILKIPTVAGYIAAGILFGIIFPGLRAESSIGIIADIGVTLLLFSLGIEFSLRRLKKLLPQATVPVLFQIFLTGTILYGICSLIGITFPLSLYISGAFIFSSTAIVIKILEEGGETEAVWAHTATGWLLVQDLAVIPLSIILATLGDGISLMPSSSGVMVMNIAVSFSKAAIGIIGTLIIGNIIVPKIFDKVAKSGSRELFLITILATVCFSAALAYVLGFSAAIGAFLAGLLISETAQNHAVFAEVRPLRDIFAIVFFVSLGLTISIPGPLNIFICIGLAVFLLSIKWLVVYAIARIEKFHRKTAFFLGISILPASEWAFILLREGVNTGVVSPLMYSQAAFIAFLTIAISAPLLGHRHSLYTWYSRVFGSRFPKLFPESHRENGDKDGYNISRHVVLCGYGRVGKYIGRALEMSGISYLVVDYNQTVLTSFREKNIPYVYGDPADKDVLDYAQVDYAKAIIIAIPDLHTQEMVIRHAKSLNKSIKIYCRVHREEDQKILKALGAHIIIQPEFEASLSIIHKLAQDFGVSESTIEGKISRLKIEHGL